MSDFYAAYESIPCPQQKCLIHLMRDLNDEILNNPFDQEMKSICAGFTGLLRPIVETIDRRGLKTRFLRKHLLTPWNNNNAEHAINAFARLRDVIAGTSSRKGVDEV